MPDHDDPLGGRLRRAWTPARLLAPGAGAAAMARARALRGTSAGDIIADGRMVAVAEEIAQTLGEMKGAAMKIGQALSFIDIALIPEEYRNALSLLQSDAPSMPLDSVEAVVAAEFGAPPAELFSYFSPNPIAAASIGQVHMAHLGDRELVVKVQYPGVARAVEADLRNAALLSTLARVTQRMLAGLVGDVDVRALVDEIRDRVGDELDYTIEAGNQQIFSELYADDPDIDVPAVVPELSSRRVLTTEYVDASRWSAALAAPQRLRDKWGTTIARFVHTSLLTHGVVNVDTHPGNYLFHDDGRVTFLDFGCVSRFDADQRRRLRHLVAALIIDDDDDVMDALIAMGLLKNRDGFRPEALLEPVRRTLEPIHGPQPVRYSREMLERVIADSLKLRVGADELRLVRRLDCPPEYILLARSTAGLEAVLAHLGAAVDLGALMTNLLGDVLGDFRPEAWTPSPDATAAGS